MLCAEFEDRLTDYLDGALEGEAQRDCAEHALRCPVCHDLLNEVRNAVVECRASVPPFRTQPNAGATTPATSSIDRKMNWCGGSIECD